jgi:DNA-directed RNA polymerase subunit L
VEKDADRKKLLETEFRSLEINRCYKVDADGEPNSFDFTVETIGMMDTYQILLRAFTSVTALANKYAKVDRTLPENLDIRPANVRMKAFDFIFSGEDHTLGNLIQTWLDDNKVGRGPAEGGVIFAGYNIPHPLRNEMVLRIATEDGKEATARQMLAQAAKGCADMFSSYASEFIAATSGRLGELAEPETPLAKGDVPTVWEAHKDVKGVEAAKAAASKVATKKKK